MPVGTLPIPFCEVYQAPTAQPSETLPLPTVVRPGPDDDGESSDGLVDELLAGLSSGAPLLLNWECFLIMLKGLPSVILNHVLGVV